MESKIIRGTEDATINPAGFISAYMHTEAPVFVQNGTDPQQGYYLIPETCEQELHVKNLIVDWASDFMTKRLRPGASWGTGITHLELGTGVGAGTQQAPEVERRTMKSLRQPFFRKAISSWSYVDALGNPTAQETSAIQITTLFNPSEAVGALTEMGLWGGDATNALGSGYMFNIKTFSVWNKQAGMILTIVWTLRF